MRRRLYWPALQASSLRLLSNRGGDTLKTAGLTSVKLTAAGACFPAGDLHDSHLRITPAMVPLPEIDRVAEIIALSIKLASAETPSAVVGGG